jgi:hypothetical protein
MLGQINNPPHALETHQWLGWLLYAAAAGCAVVGLRALWQLAQTKTPDAAPGDVRIHFAVGEATPRADRLRLTGALLLLLAAGLWVVARELT